MCVFFVPLTATCRISAIISTWLRCKELDFLSWIKRNTRNAWKVFALYISLYLKFWEDFPPFRKQCKYSRRFFAYFKEITITVRVRSYGASVGEKIRVFLFRLQESEGQGITVANPKADRQQLGEQHAQRRARMLSYQIVMRALCRCNSYSAFVPSKLVSDSQSWVHMKHSPGRRCTLRWTVLGGNGLVCRRTLLFCNR